MKVLIDRASALPPTEVKKDLPEVTVTDRQFKSLLALLTCVTLIPHLILAVTQPISYDGYWHIFIAMQDNWHVLVQEWRGDAHPFLHYALLRFIMQFGHSRLLYCLPSIIPGVAAVYVLGLAADRLYESKLSAILAAAAYGSSMTMLEINCDVRSYPLALFFMLLSFYYFADFMEKPGGINSLRALLLFGFFTMFAISSEYYAVLYFAACIAAGTLEAVLRPEFIGKVAAGASGVWKRVAAALGLPVAAFLIIRRVHRYPMHAMNHLQSFYWDKSSSLCYFLVTNLKNEVNLLFPIGIDSTGALAALFGAAAIIVVIALLRKRESRDDRGAPRSIAIEIAFFLLSMLAVLGMLRIYPFGGYARQQSVLFPFCILAAFSFIDFALARVRLPLARALLLFLTATAIGTNFYHGWVDRAKADEELFSAEYARFLATMPVAQAVYVDQYSLIGYYVHTHTWKWHFDRYIPWSRPQRLQEFELTNSDGEHRLLLRNLDVWNFNLETREFYESLAAAMDGAHVSSTNLFYLKQTSDKVDDRGLASLRNEIKTLAAAAGLAAEPLVYDNKYACIAFHRLPGAGPTLTGRPVSPGPI